MIAGDSPNTTMGKVQVRQSYRTPADLILWVVQGLPRDKVHDYWEWPENASLSDTSEDIEHAVMRDKIVTKMCNITKQSAILCLE